MDERQAKELGQKLRERRESLGMSLRQLEEKSGVFNVTIMRIERGDSTEPSAEKLARLAEALDLPLADVYAMADLAIPAELPSFKPYLRTKYRELPTEDIEAIEKYAAKLAKKHGIALDGPAPGEDES